MFFNGVSISFLLCLLFACSGPQPGNKTAAGKEPGAAPAGNYDSLVNRYRYYKPDSAVYFANKAMAQARLRQDTNSMAAMYNQLGMIDDNRGRVEESRQKYLTALALYKSTGYVKGAAAVTIRLGVVELRKGNYDKAIGYFLEALKISEQNGNKPGVMEANLTLAEGYMGQRRFDTALSYLTKAEKIDKTLPFSNLSLNIYNNFGVIYRETGDYTRAIAYLEKGISLSNDARYQGLNITLTNNLAMVYARQGFKERSIKLQKAALTKAREIKNYLRELQTLTGLAATYGKARPAQALPYLQQALDLAGSNGAHKQELEVLNTMVDMYTAQHNYRDALLMKERQYAIADSFFYRDMSAKIASLQAAYELDKSRAKVQELKYINARQRLERRIILGITTGVIVLLLVLAFYYYRTRELNGLLNKANEGLKESNTVKDKLFSVLAHDLRSPFASIINMLYFINDDDLEPAEKKEMISRLAASSNASLETLNKLLSWGEMQLKGVRLNQVKLQPGEIIKRIIALLDVDARKKNISINNHVDTGLSVFADPDHFEFVLRNLLSNAIKFTPQGGTVSISSALDKEAGTVVFMVKDSGIGIDPDRLESIFSISNISTKGTNNEKGTSLGLVMSKEFIEANQGTIWVSSRKGEGAEFMFALKQAQ